MLSRLDGPKRKYKFPAAARGWLWFALVFEGGVGGVGAVAVVGPRAEGVLVCTRQRVRARTAVKMGEQERERR